MADVLGPGAGQGLAPDIIARIASGDREAEAALVRYFAPRVRAMLLARLRDRESAHDLAQDTLLTVLQAARSGQIRDPQRIGAFVHGVARNLANNHQRGSRRRAEDQLVSDVTASESIEADYEERERQQLLRRALDAMAPGDRRILEWTLVDGLKPGDIATRLGLGADVVRTRKSRALKRVLDAIAGLSRRSGSGPL